MTERTPFTETYEEIEFYFDKDWAEYDVLRPAEERDGVHFDLIVRDGVSASHVSLNREQAVALCDLVDAQIAAYDTWLEEQANATDTTGTTDQETN